MAVVDLARPRAAGKRDTATAAAAAAKVSPTEEERRRNILKSFIENHGREYVEAWPWQRPGIAWRSWQAATGGQAPRVGKGKRMFHKPQPQKKLSRAKMLMAMVGLAPAVTTMWSWQKEGRAVLDGIVDKKAFTAESRRWYDLHGKALPVFGQILEFNEKLFDLADLDGNGVLDDSEQEYAGLLRRLAKPVDDEEGSDDDNEQEPDEKTVNVGPVDFSVGFEAVEFIMQTYDTDRDGVINEREYINGMQIFAQMWRWLDFFDDPQMLRWMQDTWVKVDVDGNDVLTKGEVYFLSLLCDSVTGSRMFIERSLVTVLFDDVDINKDGKLSKGEVQARLRQGRRLLSRNTQWMEQLAPLKKSPRMSTIDGDIEKEPRRPFDTWELLVGTAQRFRDADADGDGHLDKSEAMKVVWNIWEEF